jgi:hypothetical protein
MDTFHTFGCPSYVLNPKLQGGQKIPKWQPRSRQAIFIGFSKQHSQSVPCVYNPRSRLTSPQFHVVFDDTFGSTICATTNELPSNWPSLFEHARYSLFDSDVDAEFIPNLSKDFADPPDIRKQHVTFVDESESASEGAQSDRSSNHPPLALEEDFDDEFKDCQETEDPPPPQKTRNGWNKYHNHSTRFRQRFTVNQASLENVCLTNDVTSMDRLFAFFTETESIHQNDDMTSNYTRPCVYAAMKNNSDILHWGQMLHAEDRNEFEKSMEKEVNGLQDNDTFDIKE